jgi:hypothetical protein
MDIFLMTGVTILTIVTTQPNDVSCDAFQQLDCLDEVNDLYAEWVPDPSSKLDVGSAGSEGFITINWPLASNLSSAKDDVRVF